MRSRAPSVLLPGLALFAVLVGGVACGDDDDDGGGTSPTREATGAGTDAEDATVAVSDNQFSPDEVTIEVNHEVIWEWSGNNPHSVVGTFEGEEVQSPQLTGGGTFVFSFSKTGTFEYQCGVHGASMTGVVNVE